MLSTGSAHQSRVRALAVVLLALLLAGCAFPPLASTLVVFVENETREDLVFEVWIDGELANTTALPDNGATPNVRRAHEARLAGRDARIRIAETTLGLSWEDDVELSRETYVVAQLDADQTLDVSTRDTEPFFD